MKIPFGDWLPDQPPYEVQGCIRAENCLPALASSNYTQMLSPTQGSISFSSAVLGGYAAIDNNDNPHIYIGTGTKLYEIATSATDVSKAGGYSTLGYWKFTQFTGTTFGNKVIATDFTDSIQSMTVGGAAFADLSATAPKAKHLATVNQFLMVGNTNGGTIGGVTQGLAPTRVWWSKIGDPTTWPDPLDGTGAAAAAQSNYKDLPPVYGEVRDVIGGYEFGLVFQENAITRFQYQGGDVPFYINTFERRRGLSCPNGAIQIGSAVYFPHVTGFFVTDGMSVQPIGNNKVDKYWLDDVNTAYLDRVRVAHDTYNKCILWSYVSDSAITTGSYITCDKVIAYNYIDGRWAMGAVGQSIDMMFRSKTQSATFENFDSLFANLDAVSPAPDSSYWVGGNETSGVFSVSGSKTYFGAFGGTALTATIESTLGNFNPGGRAMLTSFKPLVMGSGSTVTGAVGTRTLLTDTTSWTSPIAITPRDGKCNFRADGVFHSARVIIAGGFTNATGVEPEFTNTGSL